MVQLTQWNSYGKCGSDSARLCLVLFKCDHSFRLLWLLVLYVYKCFIGYLKFKVVESILVYNSVVFIWSGKQILT